MCGRGLGPQDYEPAEQERGEFVKVETCLPAEPPHRGRGGGGGDDLIIVLAGKAPRRLNHPATPTATPLHRPKERCRYAIEKHSTASSHRPPLQSGPKSTTTVSHGPRQILTGQALSARPWQCQQSHPQSMAGHANTRSHPWGSPVTGCERLKACLPAAIDPRLQVTIGRRLQ